jgi:glutamate dehydrogenase (NAD(P)+)
MHDRGVLVIPDFIASPGGVICVSMEYRGEILVLKEVFEVIEDKVRINTRMVLEESRTKRLCPGMRPCSLP